MRKRLQVGVQTEAHKMKEVEVEVGEEEKGK